MFQLAIFCFTLVAVLASPKPKQHPKFSAAHNLRIVNGDEAIPGQFPWQAAIFVTSSYNTTWFCAGSIISEEWILTSAGCIDGGKSVNIQTGSVDAQKGTTSTSETLIIHEAYDSYSFENDIGLIKLDSPLIFDDNTSSINLSSDPVEANVTIVVSGWGQINDSIPDIPSPTLNFIPLVTISHADCEDFFMGTIYDYCIVCAKPADNVRRSPCIGDGGDPAVVTDDPNGPLHVGIVSFITIFGCENGAPAGYTRTAYYRDWIKEKTEI